MKSDKIINFGELLKKAWQFVWKFKYLWLLGILTGGGASASTNNLSYLINSSPNTDDWQNSMSGHNLANNIPPIEKVLGASDTALTAAIIITISITIIIISLLIIYLNVTARGAIISAVNGIDRDKNFRLTESWHYGHKYFWKIFGFSIIFSLLIILPMIFLAAPVAIMVAVRWYVPAIIIGVLFLLIFVIYIIYLSLAIEYGERILVLENKGAWESITLGTQFLNKNWKNVLLTYLILIAVMIGAGTVLAVGILLVGGILFAMVFGLYFINQVTAIIVAIPLGLALFVVLLAANGIISSYRSTIITLAYKEIKSIN